MKRKIRTHSGTTNPAVTEREIQNRKVARMAAAEGMVLLKNEGVLPFADGEKVALFGGGAVQTIKGGTGSGDVNEREVVSIYQGFVNAGLDVVSRPWLDSFAEIYQKERLAWKKEILDEMAIKGQGSLLAVYSSHVFHMPGGNPIEPTAYETAATACYVISRTAGEDADRFTEAGDYYLTQRELKDLHIISEAYENVVVIINAGSSVDLKELEKLPNLKALLFIVQPGMEGGNALGDILTGKVTPCGKLTDTWAKDYNDFPNAKTFSHMNGNIDKEYYEEGLYVGYRYFDSFEVEPAYSFGYGLSYTDFDIVTEQISADGQQASVEVTVTNKGAVYAGKEVVQIYASCPQTELVKEYRRLCGFAKTKLLQPGEHQKLTITFPVKALSSFDEKNGGWVIEQGSYGIWVGNSLAEATLEGVLENSQTVIIEEVSHICGMPTNIVVSETDVLQDSSMTQETDVLQDSGMTQENNAASELKELVCPEDIRKKQEKAWKQTAAEKNLKAISFTPEKMEKKIYQKKEAEIRAKELVEKLTDEELIAMVIGEISKGQGNSLGAAGIMVPGAAGETSGILEEAYDVPGVSMADGPAGLRLMKSYEVDRETGHVYSQGILGALEGGFFAREEEHENCDTYYQYCTAIPVGTLLAQTWDVELMEQVGKAVAVELQEFGVAWWLAPGMNIHRNPLCGRNFEYYAEDPVVSGLMAAAMTRGVQSVPGVGTTIKHFACNNQEDNRMGSDSILTERTLREIYLRGFEIAVKTAQPMAIMTSYNLINGVHAANSRDLCMVAAREEWNFQGIIMTDWTTTSVKGGSEPWKCIAAGNDLIMPGEQRDIESIQKALADGSLLREDLKACVKRLLTIIFQTLGYEDCISYGEK